MLETPVRTTPMTYDRAATELVQCRRHLAAARRSLELAIEIFDRLNDRVDGPVAPLETVLRRLEEANAELRSAVA